MAVAHLLLELAALPRVEDAFLVLALAGVTTL